VGLKWVGKKGRRNRDTKKKKMGERGDEARKRKTFRHGVLPNKKWGASSPATAVRGCITWKKPGPARNAI